MKLNSILYLILNIQYQTTRYRPKIILIPKNATPTNATLISLNSAANTTRATARAELRLIELSLYVAAGKI